MTNLEKMKQKTDSLDGEIDPWKLFKVSEIMLAVNLFQIINELMNRLNFLIHEMHSITESERKILLVLSDNQVPYELRKIWSGPKLATEYLKGVISRVQKTFSYLNSLEDTLREINFSEVFNVDSFLSTIKLVTSR